MDFDLSTLDTPVVYKILSACIHPRPIAWITSCDSSGRINAAPYSFFNLVGSAPPTVVVGILPDPGRGLKDSARNMAETGEFVANLVPHSLVAAMNLTAVDAPRGVDELALAGLTPARSCMVAPPRIAESPVSLECRVTDRLMTGPDQTLIVARVLSAHIEDRFVKDAARGHIHAEALDLVGRLHGSDYTRCTDRFSLDRPTWAGFEARKTGA